MERVKWIIDSNPALSEIIVILNFTHGGGERLKLQSAGLPVPVLHKIPAMF